MKRYFSLFLVVLLLGINWPLMAKTSIQHQLTSQNSKPNIQHGVSYRTVADISHYYVSEKLDGVRGFWDGERLITRQGKLINSPAWFTLHWPTHPIDGELWITQGKFQTLLSCISKKQVQENKTKSCWQNVRFMMFDLPSYGGTFTQRVKQMRALLIQIPSPYLAMINQMKFNQISELDAKLEQVIAAKGEGLMLHLASSYYKSGRNSALMKLKKYQDAEATVIAHTKGKGKYQGHLGAIEVKTADGIIFKIGTGFSDNQRANPPKTGSVITFKYNGLTEAGVPRFARFWRIRKSN